jgi:hypothetical protein
MLGAILMYFVVMRLLPPPDPTDSPRLVTTLIAAAFVLVAVSFLVKSRLFSQAREAGKPGLQRTGQVLALVLCEAGALLGIAAWFITGSSSSYYPVVLGFVGVLLHHPSREP